MPTVAIVDDDVDNLLGELGNKSTKYEKRNSGFNIGPVHSANISVIDKASDEEPNQLFSGRQT